MSELHNWYSLDECVDRKKITAKLKKFVKEGKIDYNIDKAKDLLHIEDLDLEEEDIELLVDLFDSNDVFPYLDYDDEDEDDRFDDYDDEDEY
jgi:hypothetical protein